jgi:hypothetical protein
VERVEDDHRPHDGPVGQTFRASTASNTL